MSESEDLLAAMRYEGRVLLGVFFATVCLQTKFTTFLKIANLHFHVSLFPFPPVSNHLTSKQTFRRLLHAAKILCLMMKNKARRCKIIVQLMTDIVAWYLMSEVHFSDTNRISNRVTESPYPE